MWRWLRTTRLFTQLEDISAARRSLRQAEHRHSLRIKRAAVRSRILYEIHKKRIQEAGIEMAHAKLMARYKATQRVLQEHEKRERKLEQVLEARGVKMPEKSRPDGVNVSENEFKDKLFRSVEGIVGDSGGVVAKSLAKDALKDSFGKVRVGGSETAMAAGLVAGVAKEIGLSRKELDGLVELVERDGGDAGLREAVMAAMETEQSNSSRLNSVSKNPPPPTPQEPEAMHPLIAPASQLLELPPPSSSTPELTETLISELLPNIPEDQTLQASLQTLGCTATDPTTTTDFLLTTLLAHRILQHKTTPPNHEPQDQALARALSRLVLALRQQPPTITKSTLPSYISSLLPNLPNPTTPISPALNTEQISTLQTIQSRLHKEHLTRVELLLTRLDVTVSAFSRSKRASGHPFFYQKQIDIMRRNAEAVSLYQAIAAGQGILNEPKRITATEEVKQFVMGSVPDRGGRLEGSFMPAFRGRIPSFAERKGGDVTWKKGKRKRKGKRH